MASSAAALWEEQLVPVMITYFESVERFFIVHASDRSIMDSLWHRLTLKAGSADELQLEDVQLPVRCIARSEGQWFRGKLFTVWPNGSGLVEYIDYGGLETLNASEFRAVPNDSLIQHTKRLSNSCRLSGDPSEMNSQIFLEIFTSHKMNLWMRIDGENMVTCQLEVTLYFEEGGVLKCVNDEVRVGAQENGLLAMGASADPAISQMIQQFGAHSIRSQSSSGFTQVPPANGHSTGICNSFIESLAMPVGPFQQSNISPNGTSPLSIGSFSSNSDSGQLKNSTASAGILNEDQMCPTRNDVKPKFNAQSKFTCDLDALLEGPLDEGSSDDEPTPATAQKGGSPRNASAYTNDSKALTSTNLKESTIWKMRRVWAPALELKYPELEPPPARTFTSEQQVKVTVVYSPGSFYVQTPRQEEKLKCLQTAMEEGISHDTQSLPACLVETGTCCAVFSDKKKVWRRGRVATFCRAGDEKWADVELIDTGFIYRLPLNALKPISEGFVTYYPPAVYHVRLGGDPVFFERRSWAPEICAWLRDLVEDKTLFVKFLTDDSVPEVELRDMGHTCRDCCTPMTKGKVCSVNDIVYRRFAE